MPDSIRVTPDELRQAAQLHREAAEQLAAVPLNNATVMATLESLGPVFAELRDAGSALLEQRGACYRRQADAHADLADQLSHAADVWDQHEADAAAELRTVAEGGR